MSLKATKAPDSGCKVIEQLTAQPRGKGSEAVAPTDAKSNESHASTSIIERIANTRRGYLAWLALQTATISGKEPPIDREADASWRAR